MGLFDFVKEAGDKWFGDDDEPKTSDTTQVSQERIEQVRAEKISQRIQDAGIEVSDLQVAVNGETATLTGTVGSQADSEKATLCAGNQFGVSSVDCQLEVSNPEPEATFYTVQSGDSLSKIAKAHYGDAMKYPVIFEANRPMLEDPDKIYPGQVLRIPAQA